MKQRIPRLLFAGTETGVGKTTIVTGLLRYWTLQKLRVQPFKVGPDYIDPGFHTAAAMRVSHNLDSWLLSKKNIQNLFFKNSAGADVTVMEGVMGLYDGFSSTTDQGSSAEMAKMLDCPVILIVDAGKMARSAAAVVKGFQELDKKVKIAGVIFNRIRSEGHYQILKKGVEKECRIPCLGYVKPNPKLSLPEQHLGLIPIEAAHGKLKAWFDFISKEIPKNIDCDKLLKIAKSANEINLDKPKVQISGLNKRKLRCRIAYAKDEAFHFYYPDNIEVLEEKGAEMVPFSPMYEQKIPDDVDALYFGGGFPENYAGEISSNKLMHQSLRKWAKKGMPVYAECGGLMYLCDKLILKNKKKFKMAGILPGNIVMTAQLQNFGYTYVEALQNNLLFKKGEKCRGHEFHYSYWNGRSGNIKPAYKAKKSLKSKSVYEGAGSGNILASYIHLHFLTKPELARRFIEKAVNFRKKHETV